MLFIRNYKILYAIMHKLCVLYEKYRMPLNHAIIFCVSYKTWIKQTIIVIKKSFQI